MSKVVKLPTSTPAHVARLLANRGSSASFLLSNLRPSVPSISLLGREFTFVSADGEKTVHDARTLDVVIVGGQPKVSRRYFSKPYDPSGNEPAGPTCWSTDGRNPDADVPNPQSRACAICPMNEKGSHRSGMGKACSTFKPLAVMVPDDPDRVLYRLHVSGMGLFAQGEVPGYLNLAEYGALLEERGLHPSAVVTRLAFSPKQSVPVLGFKPVDYVDESVAEFLAQLEPSTYEALIKVGPNGESQEAAPKRAKPSLEDAEEEAPKRAKPSLEDAEDEAPKRAKIVKPDPEDEEETEKKAPERPTKVNAASVKAPREVVSDDEVDAILNSLRL